MRRGRCLCPPTRGSIAVDRPRRAAIADALCDLAEPPLSDGILSATGFRCVTGTKVFVSRGGSFRLVAHRDRDDRARERGRHRNVALPSRTLCRVALGAGGAVHSEGWLGRHLPRTGWSLGMERPLRRLSPRGIASWH